MRYFNYKPHIRLTSVLFFRFNKVNDPHQRRLVGALGRSIEEDVVFDQHGHGPQDEGQEEVEVDVVPGAVQLPATHSVNQDERKRVGRDWGGRQ